MNLHQSNLVKGRAFYPYRRNMNLEKSILNAIDLTGRLEAALKMDDMELCQDVLNLRGEAMAAFETWHRASSPAEKANCTDLIKELVLADRKVQAHFQTALETSAGDFRKSLTSVSTVSSGAYQTNPNPACVDRKA